MGALHAFRKWSYAVILLTMRCNPSGFFIASLLAIISIACVSMHSTYRPYPPRYESGKLSFEFFGKPDQWDALVVVKGVYPSNVRQYSPVAPGGMQTDSFDSSHASFKGVRYNVLYVIPYRTDRRFNCELPLKVRAEIEQGCSFVLYFRRGSPRAYYIEK